MALRFALPKPNTVAKIKQANQAIHLCNDSGKGGGQELAIHGWKHRGNLLRKLCRFAIVLRTAFFLIFISL